MTLSREELVKFMDSGRLTNATVRAVLEQSDEQPMKLSRGLHARHRLPENKISVNTAILQRLDNGPASVSDLKEALLSAAYKSAASLSTYIAALTIVRQDRTLWRDGEYAKAAWKRIVDIRAVNIVRLVDEDEIWSYRTEVRRKGSRVWEPIKVVVDDERSRPKERSRQGHQGLRGSYRLGLRIAGRLGCWT